MAESPHSRSSAPVCSTGRSAWSPGPAAASAARRRWSWRGSAPPWSAAAAAPSRSRRPRELAAGLAGSFEHEALDIRDEEAVDGFFDGLLERHGRLDVLVNNAGGQFLSPAEAITPKGFRTVIELNVQGTWQMTHAAATKAFIPQGGGKVLSVTLSPHNGMPGMVHSGAARAAVENMMRTLAVEWARFGIKTCALAAGQFATETLLTKYPQVVVDNLERSIPIGRAGRPEEMAWLVAYLASPAGDFVSGTTITIDGARDNWFGPWPPEAIAARRRAARRGAAPEGSAGR